MAQSAPSSPATFRGGSANHGVVSNRGPERLGGVAWRFRADGPVRSSPVIFDGTVYVGSTDAHLYALEARTGRDVWRYHAGAEIAGAALVTDASVVVVDRANRIHGVDRATGRARWQLAGGADLPLSWGHEGWDYILASPSIAGDTVLVGTGDGRLYAIAERSGRVLWTFQTGGRIRSAPAVAEGVAYVGSGDGVVYGISVRDGREVWRFETEGTELDAAETGFDRTQIYSSPAVLDGVLYIGSRDAADYAVRIRDGRVLWRHREGSAWVMSSPAVDGETVFTARSSDRRVKALNRGSGEVLWLQETRGMVYSSPVLAGPTVYVGSGGRGVHAFDAATGEPRWRYATEGPVFSTPAIADGLLVIGSDDGHVYALFEATGAAPHLAVYWDEALRERAWWGGQDRHRDAADFFENRGYAALDAAGLTEFFEARIADRAPSAVVVAMDAVPEDVIGSGAGDTALLRRYLEAGGKVVWMGFPPGIIERDESGGFVGIDRSSPGSILGVDHTGWDTDEHYMRPTELGQRWGLEDAWLGMPGVSAAAAIPLAVDDLGRAGFWVKPYTDAPGTGFVHARIGTDVSYLRQLRRVVEYGVFDRPGATTSSPAPGR